MSESEVKGAWFVSARTYLAAEPDALERVLAEVPALHREALAEPSASRWYPEAALQETLGAFRRTRCRDVAGFVDMIDACTVIGTSRFFRALLSLSTPAFVLRRVPAMWKQIRRGQGAVTVTTEEGEARLAYRDFPYFDDENYRLLTVGSLRAVVRISTGAAPIVQIADATKTSLDVTVRW